MHDLRRGKLIVLAATFEFATPRREHVLYPLGLAAVRKSDDEAVRRSKDVHRSLIDLSRLATHMREYAEAGKPACEQAGDAIS